MKNTKKFLSASITLAALLFVSSNISASESPIVINNIVATRVNTGKINALIAMTLKTREDKTRFGQALLEESKKLRSSDLTTARALDEEAGKYL